MRILGLKTVHLRILFPIFCYVHSVKQCWQKHIPPKRGGDTLLSSKIAYHDWNEQAHLIKSKWDQTDQYFLSYGWFSWKKAKKAQRCSIGNCSKVFLGYFAFLTNFLKIYNFLLNGIWFSSSRGSFSKKKLSKTDLPFKFCKIGLKNTLFISGRKMVVCCFVLLFCCFVVLLFCCFVVLLFVATLSDFGLLFF